MLGGKKHPGRSCWFVGALGKNGNAQKVLRLAIRLSDWPVAGFSGG